jgi:hypothetical protein
MYIQFLIKGKDRRKEIDHIFGVRCRKAADRIDSMLPNKAGTSLQIDWISDVRLELDIKWAPKSRGREAESVPSVFMIAMKAMEGNNDTRRETLVFRYTLHL